MDVAELHVENPARPLAWRYHLASHLFAQGRQVSHDAHDTAISGYGRYLARRANCHGLAARRRLRRESPDLHRSIQIFESEHQSTKAHLEARLLTGSTVSAIALATGIPAGAIRWYERLFFDIVSRLSDHDFVVHNVIDRRAADQSGSPDKVWKALAYFGGAKVLDTVTCADRGTGVDGYLRGVDVETRLLMTFKTTTAAQLLDARKSETSRELIRVTSRRTGTNDDSDEYGEGYAAMLQGLLTSLQFATMSPEKISQLGEFDRGPLELNSQQQMHVAMGGTLPNAEELRKIGYPNKREIVPRA